MKAEFVSDQRAMAYADDPQIVVRDGLKWWPKGAIVNHPRAFRLVQMGVAVPADDECREAANRTEEQMLAAQRAQLRVAKGIHPDDYEAFDAGEIDGYDEDGNPVSSAGA